MIISVEKKSIQIKDVKVGDMLLTDKNLLILVIHDFDEQDFMGVNLSRNECTTCYKTIEDLIQSMKVYYGYGEVVELIPSNKIEVVRRN